MSVPRTLLIVDDEPNVLRAFKRLFFESDYKVVTAGSGDEGLRELEGKDIPLVISDYRMPGMTGVEFLRRVRENSPDTIRMILSGYADVAAVVEAINDGQVYKFIGKPWNDQELLTTVMRAFEQYQLQAENARLYIELQNRNHDLEEFTHSLEQKITARTRDLEMKNRALLSAQNILNQLPAGVLGVDSEYTVVYRNNALQNFIDTASVELGTGLKKQSAEPLFAVIAESMTTQKTTYSPAVGRVGTALICSPLPRRAGVVGLFIYPDITRFGRLPGVADGREGVLRV